MSIRLASLRPRARPITPARALPEPLTDYYTGRLSVANAALAEAYRGVTTDGQIVPGLFPLWKAGRSTRPIAEAAEAFLAALEPSQRAAACFPVDSDVWRRWSNIHPFLMRHGVCLDDLSADQRERALGLLRASLSAAGYQSARDIMRLNHTIGELTGRLSSEYGEWLYWLSVMGTPSPTEPWGWQLDGHHLIVNCFVLGEQVVMTPLFMGSEPVEAETGKYAGTRVLQAEEQTGLELMRSLSSGQQERARLGHQLPGDLFVAQFRDNFELRYEGIRYDELENGQRARLRAVIETYVGRIRPDHAEVKLAEVEQHLAETHFVWIGACDEDSVFYYRVHSPVILIEFDHQRGIALDNDEPSRNHIHTVVRTPNGNDYGKDLLRQHYQQAHHHQPPKAGS